MVLNKESIKELPILWSDKKRTIFGLPLSFTTYTLNKETLTIKKGLFNINEDDIKLYRIMDITLKQNLRQRLFRIGTIHCCSNDKTQKDFDIKNIKQPKDVKKLLSQLIEEQRELKRISGREFMNSFDCEED